MGLEEDWKRIGGGLGNSLSLRSSEKGEQRNKSQWTPSTKQYRLNHDNNWKNKEHNEYVYKGGEMYTKARGIAAVEL